LAALYQSRVVTVTLNATLFPGNRQLSQCLEGVALMVFIEYPTVTKVLRTLWLNIFGLSRRNHRQPEQSTGEKNRKRSKRRDHDQSHDAIYSHSTMDTEG
jgi:hypothetical protein